MRDVEISINRRPFRIACEEDQEARLRALAKYVDHEVQGLADQFGQIGDDRLLVMVALLAKGLPILLEMDTRVAEPPFDDYSPPKLIRDLPVRHQVFLI